MSRIHHTIAYTIHNHHTDRITVELIIDQIYLIIIEAHIIREEEDNH
jgi:hypothetical protein